ncbi:hypothetical protein FH972_011278 [Carpinus fangiana]|uniref:Uncharacterized protein n=1 Tax=Carpinus fangiana TaxID=176857 RepID=A0A660KTX3_9ROSI|nr:hypothetical protein FH972_011278 [Carpinus fangiana]
MEFFSSREIEASSNDDSNGNLLRFKCDSKKWKLTLYQNHPSTHSPSSSRGISALLVEQRGGGSSPYNQIHLPCTFTVNGQEASQPSLFNSISSARVPKDIGYLHLSNPNTKKWMVLRPTNCHVGDILGMTCFKVVSRILIGNKNMENFL